MHFTVTLAGLKIIVRNIEDFVVQRFVSGPTLVSCDVSCRVVLWRVVESNRAQPSFECTGKPGTSRQDPGNGCYHP